ncbi:PASTA domain-containing protein [Saccharopolyspora tripterygii]
MTQPFNTQPPATPPQQPYYGMAPQQPYYGMAPQQPAPKKKAKKWPWIVGGVAVLMVIGMVNSGNSSNTTAPATPAALPSYSTPAPAPVVDVTLPEVAGKNGQIAVDELQALGLTAVTPASQDRNDAMVLLPANWTVTKLEPAAGTVVKSNSTVIVTMTKRGASAANPVAPVENAGPQTSGIADGSYHVGDDIEPGTYKSAGGDGRPCYWARYKNGSSEFSNIITNHLNDGPSRVTVKTGELLEIQGCQPFEKVS